MQRHVVSVEEVVLEMDGHDRRVMAPAHHLTHYSDWHSLSVAAGFHSFAIIAARYLLIVCSCL